jgi:hypothetical protein
MSITKLLLIFTVVCLVYKLVNDIPPPPDPRIRMKHTELRKQCADTDLVRFWDNDRFLCKRGKWQKITGPVE